MKIIFLILLAVSLFTTGCGVKPEALKDLLGEAAAGATQVYVYVANRDSSSVSAYRFDTSNGQLERIKSATLDLDAKPKQMVVDPKNRYLYTANIGNDKISQFNILSSDSDVGAKDQGSLYFQRSISSVVGLRALAILPNAKTLYAGGASNLKAYDLDGKTGSLSERFTIGNYPVWGLAIDSAAKYLFATMSGDDLLTGYSILDDNGSLGFTYETPAEQGSLTQPLAINSTGLRSYGVGFNTSQIYAYNRAATNGMLTRFQTLATDPNPSHIVLTPQNDFAFVLSTGTNKVLAYDVNGADGSLTYIRAIAVADSPDTVTSIAVDPEGNYLMATVSSTTLGASRMVTYAIKRKTITFEQAGVATTDRMPIAIAFAKIIKLGF